ncbi:DNA topoisomerase (ATP-hydrolyzing) subunit B [Candidatus Pacearchaeota archaeon]|nr:DNA topoisomerase (ATP-hydrolyzing) subunit B [Candidatus Pacearchaeota archaeon]
MEKTAYGASEIKVLEGLEGVRKRPAMYIGSTGKEGLHHMVYEVVDNSVDEALAGFCKNIFVTLNKDGSVTVEDDGRGIPVDTHKQFNMPAVQVALTKLHAGGKFDKKSYAISGGLHGVGVSCVNALSQKLIVEVRRKGKVYSQEYSKGKPTSKLKIVGKYSGDKSGTKITFWPDNEIFSTNEFDYKVLETRFREITFLNAGLKIILVDKNLNKTKEFFAAGGLIEFLKWINKSKTIIHKPIYFKRTLNGLVVDVGVQYNESYRENIFGFVNTINTVEGGTHISGFKTALTRVINDYAKKTGILKNGNSLMGNDVREGLTGIVSVKIGDPQFEGQTKTKLGNSEVKGFVDSIVTTALSEFFEENPAIAKKIIAKGMSSAKARLAAKKAKDLIRRKDAFSSGGLPGKLYDCSKKKSSETEVYFVEGESAGGCFSGDTKIALADGRNISFLDLIKEHKQGKENFCYTIKNDGNVGIAKIKNPRITKKNTEVLKIMLDNEEEIVCTPNHKFMLKDGTYKEAQLLTKKDSLMPLYKKYSKIGGRITIDGYEMISNNKNNRWIFTHLLADKYNLEKGFYSIEQGKYKHHIDFNKLNNNPNNVVRLSKEEHLLLHSENLKKTLHRVDIKDKARKAHKTPEYRKKISKWAKQPHINKMLSNRAKKQWKDPSYKKYMVKKFKEFLDSNEDYRRKNKEILYNEQKKYWANPENKKKASEKVKRFFKENPDAKKYLSDLAKKQWKNEELIIWRRQKTKEQWTSEFRKKRRNSLDKTYYNKTLNFMNKILSREGTLENFDKLRAQAKDKSILSLDTFCKRYFVNNYGKMLESVRLYNHKIKKIEKLNKKINVYDVEIPETHNFALASGIFVHNSAKNARDKNYQAILALKGKILNIEKASMSKALSSEEITNIITAIGTGIGDQFDISKMRYGKIVIMTDADVDGEHIKTLLLTFFFRFMPELIKEGKVYAAMPPLYRVRKKKDYYVYSEEELKRLSEKLSIKEGSVTRFKGLGEMSVDQLWETTMNPKTRKIKKIYIEDAVEADRIFSMLMGDDVQSRKEFIQENAKEAELDI